MLSDGIHRYLFVEWNPMGSMGIQRSPSMSIGITGLVVNLRQVQHTRNMPRS